MVIDSRVSVSGSYIPPDFKGDDGYYVPPQTTIQSPVHTIVGAPRASGASSTEMGLQVFVMGSYVPPVFKVCFPLNPPQTIIWFPVHTVV